MQLLRSTLKLLVFFGLLLAFTSCNSEKGKHLFILSGQSNMALLKPEESFTPTVEEAFGAENVIVVKNAYGGQPIHRWYRSWKAPNENGPLGNPDLYDSLMTRVQAAIQDQQVQTVSFVWMQGESDARQLWGEVYEKSLIGLYHQLSQDLKHTDMNFVIGRLSDFDLENERFPHWQMVRTAQEAVAESNPRFAWVNTDDLNDGQNRAGKEIKDDLHMSGEGYVVMGKRFADKAIELIRKDSK